MASLMNDAKQYYGYLTTINQQNNAASQANAREQMAFQERMSNTAHQREVADLKAAGLNPVLSAGGSGGGGASSVAGAMGQTDMSSASALTSYLQSLIQQQTSMSVAQINAAAMRDSAAMSSAATKYAADRAYDSAQNNTNTWSGLARRYLDDIFGGSDNITIGGQSWSQAKAENGLIITAKMTGQYSANKPQGFADWLNRMQKNNPWLFNKFMDILGMFSNGKMNQSTFETWIKMNFLLGNSGNPIALQ